MSDLTHVELLWLEKRIENWVRFGHAVEEKILDKRRRIILGPDVQLEVLDGGTGAPLTVRVRVQGHWKRQPHGPGKAERKIIWIQPYWRGPDDKTPPEATRHTLV